MEEARKVAGVAAAERDLARKEAKDAQDVVVGAIIMEGDRMKIGTLKVGDVMMAIIET